jgi:hypothetical protein
MPYGRGGAGNILQAKEDSKKVVEVRTLPFILVRAI